LIVAELRLSRGCSAFNSRVRPITCQIEP